jgi:hypothetical protein
LRGARGQTFGKIISFEINIGFQVSQEISIHGIVVSWQKGYAGPPVINLDELRRVVNEVTT